MSEQTITRADLSDALFHELGLSRSESSDLIDMIFDEISAALIQGEDVKISSYGSFILRRKAERIGRNPKTGVEVPITPRTVLIFRPSHILKDKINKA